MQNPLQNRALLLILLLLTIAGGYLGFRFFYQVSADFPFSQEILLVFIGAVATVLITALLLSQQTELELRKEGQVLLLDRKSTIYSALIEHIGEIVEKGQMNDTQLRELKILNHKLAMIGGAEVIRQFSQVLARLDQAVSDGTIGGPEQDLIMKSVAVLTYHMRADLLGRIASKKDDAVLRDILANSGNLQNENAS